MVYDEKELGFWRKCCLWIRSWCWLGSRYRYACRDWKAKYSDIPDGLQGLGITFITVGFDVLWIYVIWGYKYLMIDLIEIIFGIVAFTLIVNMMIFVILFARTKLVSTGDVTVEINGDLKAMRSPQK